MSYYRQGPYRPSSFGFGVPRLTPYVKILIVACVAVWLFQYLIWIVTGNPYALTRAFGLVPAYAIGRGPLGVPFLWQLGTYMFLHSLDGIFHILFNMLMLWLFGGELETLWGGRAFLRYYLVCGVGAGVLAVVLGFALPWGQPLAATIGASGAIYGVMIAFGMVFAQRTILFMMIFPMKAWTFALIMFAISFFSAFSGSNGVAHAAHLGGAVTGYLYLKRAWRLGEFTRELRWKFRRRRFRVMPPDDPDDRWLN